MPNSPDSTAENHGSIFLLRPQKKQAINCTDERNLQRSGFQHYSPTIAVEHHCITYTVAGIRKSGWVLPA
jgi:hypothetical protein